MSEVIDAPTSDAAAPAALTQPRPLAGPLLWVSPIIIQALYEQRVPGRAGPVWPNPTVDATVGLYTGKQIMSWVQPIRPVVSPALDRPGAPHWRAGFDSGWNACCKALHAALLAPEMPVDAPAEVALEPVPKEGRRGASLPEGWALHVHAGDGHIKLTSPDGRTRVFSEGHGDVVVSAFFAALAGAQHSA
jgi:hypothetical protein